MAVIQVSDALRLSLQILIERTSPVDYRDGAEHPRREAIKRVFGIKSVGPAYNPADTGPLPPKMRGILDREGRWS